MPLRSAFLLLVLAITLQPASAQVLPINRKQPCTMIAAVPYTITAPGSYCLNSNHTTAYSYGIQIQASDVRLDCKGHAINRSVRDGGSDGITATSDLQNVTIQSCRIDNFDRGVNVGYRGRNFQLLNNHVDNALSIGISVWGHGARVVGNRVTNTHNIPGQYSTGIHMLPFEPSVSATSQVVMNNVIAGSSGDAQVVGLHVSGSASPQVTGNQILDLQVADGGYGMSLWLSDWAQGAHTTGVKFINNTLMSRNPDVLGVVGQPELCVNNIAIGLDNAGLSSCLAGQGNTLIP